MCSLLDFWLSIMFNRRLERSLLSFRPKDDNVHPHFLRDEWEWSKYNALPKTDFCITFMETTLKAWNIFKKDDIWLIMSSSTCHHNHSLVFWALTSPDGSMKKSKKFCLKQFFDPNFLSWSSWGLRHIHHHGGKFLPPVGARPQLDGLGGDALDGVPLPAGHRTHGSDKHTHYFFPSLTDCGRECSTTCPPYRSLGSHAVSGAAFKIPVVMCHTIADVLKNSFKSTSLAFDDPVIVGASLDNVNMETGVCPYRMQPPTCLSRPTSASRRLLKECACSAPFAHWLTPSLSDCRSPFQYLSRPAGNVTRPTQSSKVCVFWLT